MGQSKILITTSQEETIKRGEDIAETLKGGEVLCLYGELGSGKTTFTKGIAKGLGIQKRILSPTFIIVRHYKLKNNLEGLFHFDLYRLSNKNEARDTGLDEYIKNKKNIVIIEWPEKLETNIPKKRIDIHFKYLEGDKREIKITKNI